MLVGEVLAVKEIPSKYYSFTDCKSLKKFMGLHKSLRKRFWFIDLYRSDYVKEYFPVALYWFSFFLLRFFWCLPLPWWLRMVKNLPVMQETWLQSLSWELTLEKEMATHSSILAWRIPRQRSLAGYSPQSPKESDTTQWLIQHHF